MLKIIALILLAVIALFLGFAATRPDDFRIQRSIVINAKPELVFPWVSNLKQIGIWSPWEKKDPNMKRSFSGPESGVGAAYAWEGNKEIGKGRMEVTEVTAPSKVAYKLDFLKPMEAHNMAEFTLKPVGDATEVTWAMYGPQPFIGKVIGLIMNCDKMVGGEFEKGLKDLKELVEKE